MPFRWRCISLLFTFESESHFNFVALHFLFFEFEGEDCFNFVALHVGLVGADIVSISLHCMLGL